MDIGFIGLGIMGAPMAGHLQSGGHTLHVVKHRSPIPQEILDGRSVEHDTAATVARQAEIIITMVPDTPDVERVLFDKDGVASGLSAGKTVVEMSSISPIDTKAFAKRINDLGCEYLDAPVSGGEMGAQAAALTIMVGGSQETFDAVKPLFELMGKNMTLVGANGAGQTAKVANQIVVALTVEAVGEALLFASKAGVDPARVRDALMGGFAGSKIMEIHGERMIKTHVQPRLSHRAASERSKPGVERRSGIGTQPAQYGHYPGAVQQLRRERVVGSGPLSAGQGIGEARRSPRRTGHRRLRRTTRDERCDSFDSLPAADHHGGDLSRRASVAGESRDAAVARGCGRPRAGGVAGADRPGGGGFGQWPDPGAQAPVHHFWAPSSC